MQLYSKIEGQGKALLILHGFLGMSDNWNTLGAKYVADGFEVHLLDLRNHGRSPHSEVFNYTSMADDIYEYCQQHNLKNIDLIGHSMGGKIGMFFAMTHPDLLDKLIIADIAPRYYPPHHDEIMAGLMAVDFSIKPSRADVDTILQHNVPDFGTRQFLMKSLYWKEPGQLAFRFNLDVFTKEFQNIGEALKDNTVFEKPTLFLRGAKSNYIADSDIVAIKRHFPNAKLETIPQAGHWLHAENPLAFYQESILFLK